MNNRTKEKLARDLALQKARHKRTGGNLAAAHVALAIKRGELPKLDGKIACKDCGKSATQYDHRDYNKMFEVEPVCASCNQKRGPAIFIKKSPIDKL